MAFTYSKLASSTVGVGGAATITFNNIPQNYTDLVLKVSARNSGAYAYDYLTLRLNSSTSSYTTRSIQGDGTAASSSAYTADTYIRAGFYSAGNNTASTFGSTEIYIPNYAGSNNKSISSDSAQETNATAANLALVAGLWSNVTAINNITLLPTAATFAQYSTATLYGIRVEL